MPMVPTNFGNSRGSLLWNEKSVSEGFAVTDNINGAENYSDRL